MAALNDIKLPTLAEPVARAMGTNEAAIKDYMAAQLWKWIHANAERDVWRVKVWVVSKTFRVKDLHPVFEVLLGKDPFADIEMFRPPEPQGTI